MGILGHDGLGNIPSASTHLEQRFGQKGGVGARGEQRFLRTLHAQGHTHNWRIWTSLDMPTPAGWKPMISDVDGAAANGNVLELFNVKAWAGNAFWSVNDWPFDGLRPLRFRDERGNYEPWKQLGKNDAAALDRFRAMLPGVTVNMSVIFVADDNGRLPQFTAMRFPGNISSFIGNDGLEYLKRKLGTERRPVTPAITRLMDSLLR
ncbi:hypothetical protein [Leifsonia xyli]|uniref:hypothetical protein n=1 Tax=Leifsonia xyli TaxID=1575 RepID=UPI003D66F009